MKLLTVLLSLAAAATVHAEIVVYTQSYSETVTGKGAVRAYAYTGYFILSDEGDAIQLDVQAKSKTFQAFSYEDFRVNYLRAAAGKRTVALLFPIGDVGGVFLKGTVSTVNTGTMTFNIGKTLTVSGAAFSGEDPDALAAEFKGSMVYSPKLTVPANLAGNDAETTLAALKAALIGKGYTEIQ